MSKAQLPKVHPRRLIVQQASNEISSAVTAAMRQHDLTDLEVLAILNEIAATTIKYALREERHPDDPSQPADRL